MVSVVVLFPKLENAKYIRNILVRNGIEVTAVHTSGAQAILTTENMDEGLVICGYRFKDMMYGELREYLPDDFEMLLISSQTHWDECADSGVVRMMMPIKAFDLVETVNMMLESLERKRRKRRMKPKERSVKEKQLIRRAKEILMDNHGMTEEEAHRYLQKRSMDSGTNLVEMSQMVLDMYLDGVEA
ncbi:MAG: ANTAR domain-containing protein [Lachnospiraceae bacterium]|nr:ANTAR domain-containing protein [Lachnospiraceae bacterium]